MLLDVQNFAVNNSLQISSTTTSLPLEFVHLGICLTFFLFKIFNKGYMPPCQLINPLVSAFNFSNALRVIFSQVL